MSFGVGACLVLWMKNENLALQWLLTIFLIPFVLIGLMILTVTVATLLQYFCRYQITLDETGVHYRRSWFGIGRTRHWDYGDIRNVTVLRNTKKLKLRDIIRNLEIADNDGNTTANCYPYTVYFSDGTGVRKTSGMIRDLLEGEARFIAAKIRQRTNTRDPVPGC